MPAWALAASVAVGDIAVRDGPAADPTASAAFREGAAEAGPAVTPAASAPFPGLAELEKGEDEYLKGRFRTAEKLLAQACDAFLTVPESLQVEPASRAFTLLAEVQLASNRAQAAEKTLERAVRNLPEFPGPGASPAPEVQTVLDRLGDRLQGQLGGVLSVEGNLPGVAVSLAGRALGEAPLRREHLPPRGFLVELSRPREPVQRRIVDLSRGPVSLRWAEPGAERAALAAAAVAGNLPSLFAAAGALESATGAETSCLALAHDDRQVLVVQLAGGRQRLLGGQPVNLPDSPSGWRALGRYCAPGAPLNLDAAAVARLIQPDTSATPPSPGEGQRIAGWSLLGVGVIAAGGATYFGLDAFAAADRHHNARTPAAARHTADDARSSALIADIGFGTALALGIGGAVLLVLQSGKDAPRADLVQSNANSP